MILHKQIATLFTFASISITSVAAVNSSQPDSVTASTSQPDSVTASTSQPPKQAPKQLNLSDLKIFESSDASIPQVVRDEVIARIKEETNLEPPRSMAAGEKKKIAEAFNEGKAANYNVQQLVDAGVFKYKPILNLHPNCPVSDDDKSVRPRDGKEVEIDNAVWGKKNLPAILTYGVIHSTEDITDDAAVVIDEWNQDASAGKRSSSTPFVVGRCVNGPEIYVTADFESRWQRHCSSKLTSRPNLVNWTSIGVEMVHSTERKVDYTDEEIKNAARLWTYIQQRAKIPDNYLITHGEIQGHLPKDHKSFRTDPEGFYWDKFAAEMIRLRKQSGFNPPPSDPSQPKTMPQKALEQAAFITL